MEWGFGVCMFGCEGEWECVHNERAEWEVADESLLPPMEWGFGVCMFGCEGDWECVLVSESEKWEWEVKVTNNTVLEFLGLEYQVAFFNPKCNLACATVAELLGTRVS